MNNTNKIKNKIEEEKRFEIGETVIVKYGNYPWWPAEIKKGSKNGERY